MRMVWLTDLHLNFVTRDRCDRLLLEIAGRQPDAVLIGGDIAEAASFADSLREMADSLLVPIYFVLGNHDYYRGSIATVRETARELCRTSPLLHWLPPAGVVSVGQQTALVGHGGWGDGLAAGFLQSEVVLNDYRLIEELREATGLGMLAATAPASWLLNEGLLDRLNSLGQEAADHFRAVLPAALESHEHVYVLMHVPPFREACWHEGRISDKNWLPHFTCVAAGAVLREIMEDHPHRRMTVFCGHTHGGGHAAILPNLEVITGAAEYSAPCVQGGFEVQ